jgi:hypothetical protein
MPALKSLLGPGASFIVMNSADWIRWIIPYGDDG